MALLHVGYSPTHGSWLNQAEIEIGIFSRQCLGNRRIPDLKTAAGSKAWNLIARRRSKLTMECQNSVAKVDTGAKLPVRRRLVRGFVARGWSLFGSIWELGVGQHPCDGSNDHPSSC
jgi:hypothetical protein